MSIAPEHLRRIGDRDSLLKFLRDDLDWPAPPDLPADDLLYDYSADELRLGAQTGEQVRVQQLANFHAGQPWGVFLLKTATPKLYSTQLRQVLRGLAPSLRHQPSHLKAWPAENLLFIATQDYQQFTFAHFKGERASTAQLSAFNWTNKDVGLRTLCEYNLPALTWPHDEDDRDEWLKKWSGAFDVEKVTNEFFKEFRDLFEDLKDALPKTMKKAADRHAFTQRLLNRLLFLSFLQKKRWLKTIDLPHPRTTYLFELYDFALAQHENFYSDYLYDLFFNALNRPPNVDERERTRIARKLGIVPFLNGGLFDTTDEWDERGAIELPNKFFEPILGKDGLLRRYNFTVTESTPLNQEVAVDPEMLGKVFETVVLTSEEAEDYQAPNLRKATGSYYTPRIVVAFIVREVLKDYLTARIAGLSKAQLTRLMEMDAMGGVSKDAHEQLRLAITQAQAQNIRSQLSRLRACDPAIGSGAFALGLLHELVNLHLLCETLERGKDPRLADPNLVFTLKKRIIEQNIYGVDLQAKAVEICKLRLWLSMVVDYQTPGVDLDECTEEQFERAIAEIPALPNLSYKIRRGDALLDLVHGHAFRLEQAIAQNKAMQDERDDLEDVHRRFFGAQDPNLKRKLRRDALVHRTRLSRLQLEQQREKLLKQGTQLDLMGERKETRAQIRQRERAIAELEAALAEVMQTENDLKPLLAKKQLTQADDELLMRLESASEDEATTFSWELDFPEIFAVSADAPSTITGKMRGLVDQTPGQMELRVREIQRGGFDVIVGNPPFVTARDEIKRELYRERWKETSYMKFQLVAPFFQRSFGLLRPAGYLGFVVSNAFAKREFGRPLIEDFFPTVELQKIVDCSGLMFPGHGTPTCILFGRNRKPSSDSAVRIAATLPGGGDLRTPPEKSPLWATLQAHHDQAGYSDDRIMVSDRPSKEMAKWPLNLDINAESTRIVLEGSRQRSLRDLLSDDIGFDMIFGAREVFVTPLSFWRSHNVPSTSLIEFIEGDTLRDYVHIEQLHTLYPYNAKLEPYLASNVKKLLEPWRKILEDRPQLGGLSQVDFGLEWYEYYRFTKRGQGTCISFPEIATHAHFVYSDHTRVFTQTAPVVKLLFSTSVDDYFSMAGLLNSDTALFWLKQVCFNKGAGDEQERDRFVYAGGKVQQLPIPAPVLDECEMRERLVALSRACWERGQQLPSLAFQKLFEHKDEAYYAWNSSLSGWVKPWGASGTDWRSARELFVARDAYSGERERLRRVMVALQEEMDWLVYAAYGLLPLDHAAVALKEPTDNPNIEPLSLGERPFELLHDNKPIPEYFSAERRALWDVRMKVIGENEHIRRIEQPVYKRRWYRKQSDEQEFERAFEWWLLEKAEWWLEHKAKGGPVTLEGWATALWDDERVRAAVAALADERASEGDRKQQEAFGEAFASAPEGFIKRFKSIVVESSVPDWIPPAVAWERVEKKFKQKVPARAKRIRGKLNVPRERFRTNDDGEYLWAGKHV